MTAIPGVGIDLLDIGRLERALERSPGLVGRLFDPEEQAACAHARRPARHLAARFCAKEAAIKALGLRGAKMTEIVVSGGFGEHPSITLKGKAAELANQAGVTLQVSLTHERESAAAVVIASR